MGAVRSGLKVALWIQVASPQLTLLCKSALQSLRT
jgi:hypothetical protein